MVSKEQYEQAVAQKERAQQIINQFSKEAAKRFKERMSNSPIFTDDELLYSATSRCVCGHGMAYPKTCGAFHYWDCAAILKGTHDTKIEHTARMPFVFYTVKSEGKHKGSTRPPTIKN